MHEKDFEEQFPGRLVPTQHNSPAFVPDPLPPRLELDQEVRDRNEAALLALGELRAMIPALPNPELITKPFLRREAVLSSKIEGTHTEIEGLYLFETVRSEQAEDAVHVDDDAQEVHNYVTALEHGLAQLAKLPICNRLLKQMHKRLMTGVRRDRGKHKAPGRFRRTQAFMGSSEIEGARYVAPPEDRVEGLMADLETYINTNSELPTLVRTSLVHYQFEAIHPFTDGNGRLGRVLVSLMLIVTGILHDPLLYLSAYFERNRIEYVDLLWQVSRRGAWTDWILFFLEGVRSESEDAVLRARTLLRLREDYRAQLQSDKGAASLLALLDQLFLWPAITVNGASRVLEMSYAGAQRNVDKLVERGILEEVTGNLRNRVFVARPVIRLVS